MKKILWGLFFVIMAFLLILGQVMELPSTMTMIFTLFFGAVLIEGLFSKNIFVSMFAIAMMLVLNKAYLGIDEISNFSIIASAMLLSTGLSMLFSKKRNAYFESKEVSTDASDIVTIDVNFGSTIKYISSADFKKAMITTNFGEAKVYFDNANIVGDTAEIEIDASFAGVELYIPKEWKVINRVNSTFAAVDERGRTVESIKTIIIKGRSSFAGIEINYI